MWQPARDVLDQRVHVRACVRRVGDDRVGVAVRVKCQRILAGGDVGRVMVVFPLSLPASGRRDPAALLTVLQRLVVESGRLAVSD